MRVAGGKRRWGRILAVVGLVLIVGLVVADRVGVVVAEATVAKQARAQLASEDVTMPGNPTVTIDGFPFLTQVAAGHYDKINIVVPQPMSKGIRLDSLDVTATGVNAPTRTVISGDGEVKADSVTGTARIGWTAFQQLIDLSELKQYGVDPTALKISSTNGGEITLSAPITILGHTFTAIASGTMSVREDLLHVQITKIDAADGGLDSLVASQLQALVGRMTFDTRIPELPYHLVIDDVSANSAGVDITATAKDVTLGS
jgi:hypothetical protein